MKPLDGIRVIDCTNESGVFAGRLLADLGADVIRVEDPAGDSVRRHQPVIEEAPSLEGGYLHLACNAGKRSLALDLAAQAGMDQFLRLVRTADVLLETWTPGSPPAPDLAYGTLGTHNPGLVHVSITPFGSFSPWAGRKGADLTVAAAGGLLYVSGEPDRPPVLAGGNMSYKLASLAACTGAVAALRGRDQSPQRLGTHVDISMQECVALSTMQTANANYWRWHGIAPPRNTAQEFPVVRCRDGLSAVARARPDRWPALREWAISRGITVHAGPDDWREANRAQLGSFRLGEAADIVEQLATGYDRAQFLDLCWATGLICLPVHSFEDMRMNEHLRSINTFVPLEHAPLGLMLELPKSPFSGMREAGIAGRAPLLGEHNAEILAEPDRMPPRGGPVAPMTTPSTGKPLTGLRVLDISWVLAGPIATRILANLGAEVLKVESETRMDSIRGSVPPPSGPTLTAGGWFNTANSGKLSVTVNTTFQAGRSLLRRLAATCDIVLDNLRPGVVARMGLAYAELRALNPGIIVVHMPGPGRGGPWEGLATFGNQIAAAAGINTLTGFRGTAPTGLGVAFADFVSPYIAASAALAAICEREHTGDGQEIEVAQLPGVISLLSAEWMQFRHTGEEPPRRANRDPNYCPHGAYPARGDDDEWIAIAVSPDEWPVFCAVIGRQDLVDDPRFATHDQRKANEDALDALLSGWTSGKDRWEIADLLQRHGFAAAAVESIADHLDRDPCLARYYQVVHQPTDPGLDITVNGEAIRFPVLDGRVTRAPALGEHNEYVFREIVGLSEDEFTQLLADAVIG
jgi:crotonobetainyl-CoA:carnitine CoA-transferase CaiB-like acyl-CoA transferase